MTGTTLGHYEIGAKLGEGGMGAVYRASDRRLGREVAVKVLPPEVASTPDRLVRFEREARALASLNHPNVATLYGFEDHDGSPFLVMELVAGRTLRDRIARGALPVTEALTIAKQMAEGLEAAHERGIIHRDLKPDNVMITLEGRTKLVDFGLAKAFDALRSAEEEPTVTMSGTAAGLVIGTVSYMSPEQARGAEVDKRTDIWAFGCCLFEMLTGRRTFGGDTPTDVIAKIIEVEPDWRRLEGLAPPRVRDLLAACLTKDPRNRLHDIADARIEIDRALAEPVERAPRTRATWRTAAIIAALAAVAGGAAVWMLARPATPPPSVSRAVIPLRVSGASGAAPSQLDIANGGIGASVAISPDGQTVAYVMWTDGIGRLYVRRLDRLESTAVEDSDGATLPLFSPDGQYVAFLRSGTLFRAALTGGAPTRVADDIDNSRGVDWCGDEVVFTRDVSSALFKVSINGGAPTRLTSLDSKRREKSHRFPHVLPGCRAVLFTIGTSTTESWGDGELAIASMETGEYRIVLPGGSFARYSPSGHLLYNRGGTLYAAAFDLERLEVTGSPRPVVGEVMSVLHGGSAEFALAQNGTLVYAPGRSKMDNRQLTRIDRNGKAVPFLETPREFASFRLSPDGRYVAAQLRGGIESIWLFDIARGAATRWTTEWDNAIPIWDPTGRQIMFTSPRQSAFDLYRQPVDAAVAAERIATSNFTKVATSWSPDGTAIAYQERGDIYILPLTPGSKAVPFVNSRAAESWAAFSPSGAWLAYGSDESGREEVYVRRFPDGRDRQQVSVDGGTNPVWNPDGSELFYRNGFKMMAVSVQNAATMTMSRPRALYERRFGRSQDDGFSVTPDGRYFIDLDDSVAEPPPTELVVVQHFASELSRLAPPAR
jgi:serine/threonine-protein kinase